MRENIYLIMVILETICLVVVIWFWHKESTEARAQLAKAVAEREAVAKQAREIMRLKKILNGMPIIQYDLAEARIYEDEELI